MKSDPLRKQIAPRPTAQDASKSKDSKSITDVELHRLQDRANLFDHIMDAPCYVSFFTGYDGQGAAIRETLIVRNRHHMDNVLYNMAMRKAKKLGASSWVVFKPVGAPHNVEYGRYGDESRLDFIENQEPIWADDAVTDLVATDKDGK